MMDFDLLSNFYRAKLYPIVQRQGGKPFQLGLNIVLRNGVMRFSSSLLVIYRLYLKVLHFLQLHIEC